MNTITRTRRFLLGGAVALLLLVACEASAAPEAEVSFRVGTPALRLRQAPRASAKTLRKLELHERLLSLHQRSASEETYRLNLPLASFDVDTPPGVTRLSWEATAPWIKVRTEDGLVGWVFGGAVTGPWIGVDTTWLVASSDPTGTLALATARCSCGCSASLVVGGEGVPIGSPFDAAPETLLAWLWSPEAARMLEQHQMTRVWDLRVHPTLEVAGQALQVRIVPDNPLGVREAPDRRLEVLRPDGLALVVRRFGGSRTVGGELVLGPVVTLPSVSSAIAMVKFWEEDAGWELVSTVLIPKARLQAFVREKRPSTDQAAGFDRTLGYLAYWLLGALPWEWAWPDALRDLHQARLPEAFASEGELDLPLSIFLPEIREALASILHQDPLASSALPLRPRLAFLDVVEAHLDAAFESLAPEIWQARYCMVGRRIRRLIRIYQRLRERPGLEASRRAYASFMKTRATWSTERAPLRYYLSFMKQHALDLRAGTFGYGGIRNSRDVGFWMRRLNDGSARKIYALLAAIVKRLDPEFHRKEVLGEQPRPAQKLEALHLVDPDLGVLEIISRAMGPRVGAPDLPSLLYTVRRPGAGPDKTMKLLGIDRYRYWRVPRDLDPDPDREASCEALGFKEALGAVQNYVDFAPTIAKVRVCHKAGSCPRELWEASR